MVVTNAAFDGPDMFDPAIFDTRISNFGVMLNENVIVGDAINLQSKYFRELDESSVPLFDGPDIFDPAIFDTINKGVVVSDQLTRIAGNPRLITEPIINVFDSITRKLESLRVLVENTTIGDGIARLTDQFRTITQTVTNLEFISIGTMSFVSISEINIEITELLNRKLDLKRQINEAAIIISELLVRVRDAPKNLIENVTTSEIFSTSFIGSITFNEAAVAISDVVLSKASKIKIIIQNTTISELLVVKLNSFRTFAENISIIDNIKAIFGGRFSFKPLTSNLCIKTSDETDLAI